MSCKDCKDNCDTIYRRIKPVDSFDFSIDTIYAYTYYYPINLVEGNLSKNYYTHDEFFDMRTEITQWKTDNGYSATAIENYGGNKTFFYSITNAIDYISNDATLQPNADYFKFYIYNTNLDNYTNTHPSVLRRPPFYYQDSIFKNQPIDSNPTWKLSFPLCGTSGSRDLGDKSFSLNKKCKNYKLEYRLRLRPLSFITYFALVRDISNCYPFSPPTYGNIFDGWEYDDYKEYFEMIQAMQTKDGHKWLGFTPIRIETGIYSHNKNEYKPIVWSDGNYPQNVLNYRHVKYDKNEPRKIKCSLNSNISHMKLGPNVSSDYIETSNISTSQTTDIYYNFANTLTDGFFTVDNNNMNNPTKIIFDDYSQISGTILDSNKITQSKVTNVFREVFVNYLNPAEYPSASSITTLNMSVDVYDNNRWISALHTGWGVSNIYTGNVGQLEFTVDSANIYGIKDEYVTVTQEGPNGFIETANGYPFRYSFDLYFQRNIGETYAYSNSNVSVQNYTQLMDDFLIELEGFVDIDMEDETDISIYLKILPDNTTTVNFDMSHRNYFYDTKISPGSNINTFYLNQNNCNANILSDVCYPWGDLSMDPRNEWQKKDNPYYEPLLPLKHNKINDNNNLKLTGTDYWDYAAEAYRWGMSLKTPSSEIAVLIEDGWVRITPDCDDCCDD